MIRPFILLASFLTVVVAPFTNAQSAKDVFSPKTNMIWLGLDFTGAKFIGEPEKYGSESDVKKLVLAWNRLLINEAEKFDVGEVLDRPPLKEAIALTIEHNEKLDLSDVVKGFSKEKSVMTQENISQIVSSYDFRSLGEGVGVLFVVEAFNKLEKKSFIWVTFINLNTKEVLFAERIIGAPFGSGLRNYWAGGVNNTLKQIKTKFSAWKKKYGEK